MTRAAPCIKRECVDRILNLSFGIKNQSTLTPTGQDVHEKQQSELKLYSQAVKY